MHSTNSTVAVWARPDGWALGSFRDSAEHPLTGLVLDDVAFDIHRLLARRNGAPRSPVTVRALLDDWEASFERLHEFAAEIRTTGIADPRWESVRIALRDLRVLAPVQPSGHVFQAGANYRQHVIELLVAQRVGATDGVDAHELRERSVNAVDERIDQDTPYVFLGLPSAEQERRILRLHPA